MQLLSSFVVTVPAATILLCGDGAGQNNISAIIKYNIALSKLARAQGVPGHGLSIEGIETR